VRMCSFRSLQDPCRADPLAESDLHPRISAFDPLNCYYCGITPWR
jgi:hypothetical protein